MQGRLKLGTRGSPLALAQARKVASAIESAQRWPDGYIEIVPMRMVTFTDWTFDQAMSFVVTGGSSAPDTVRFARIPLVSTFPELTVRCSLAG